MGQDFNLETAPLNSREIRRLAAESHNREFERKQNLRRFHAESIHCFGARANRVAVATLLAIHAFAVSPDPIDRPRGKYAPAGFRK